MPFLIFHGDKDNLVPVAQSQNFHDALRRNSTASQLVIYQGEGHGFAKKENLEDFMHKTLDFLRSNLQPEASAP